MEKTFKLALDGLDLRGLGNDPVTIELPALPFVGGLLQSLVDQIIANIKPILDYISVIPYKYSIYFI